jgi:hypothetical protein
MKRINLVLLLAVGLLGSGCGSFSEKKVAVTAAPPIAAPMPPVPGTQLDLLNVEKVRVGETLKSYPVGRYVDANDANVMHEAHVVYRKEAGAAWNTNPNAPTVVPLGPVLAVADPAKTPGLLPQELEQKMAEQNQLMASLIEQNEALAKQLGRMSREIAEMRQKQSASPTEGGK